jgi:hypothetical protein
VPAAPVLPARPGRTRGALCDGCGASVRVGAQPASLAPSSRSWSSSSRSLRCYSAKARAGQRRAREDFGAPRPAAAVLEGFANEGQAARCVMRSTGGALVRALSGCRGSGHGGGRRGGVRLAAATAGDSADGSAGVKAAAAVAAATAGVSAVGAAGSRGRGGAASGCGRGAASRSRRSSRRQPPCLLRAAAEMADNRKDKLERLPFFNVPGLSASLG